MDVDCGFPMVFKAIAVGLAIAAPFLAGGGWGIYAERRGIEERGVVIMARLAAHDRLVAARAGEMLPLDTATHGRDLFTTSCSACHNFDGTGREGLGKDLTKSWFVASLNDQ